MKIVLAFFVVAVFVTGSLAQNRGNVGKGGKCTNNEECVQDAREMKCLNNYCGCRRGERQEVESHADNTHVYVCSEVVGKGCNTHDECVADLEHSECINQRCACNKDKGCTSLKNKGEECKSDDECVNDARHMRCANNYCGCKKGQRQQERSTGGALELVCTNVVGLGCTRDEDCNVDLEKAKCNMQSQTCECKKDDGCNGASTMAMISFLPMVFLSIGLLKW